MKNPLIQYLLGANTTCGIHFVKVYLFMYLINYNDVRAGVCGVTAVLERAHDLSLTAWGLASAALRRAKRTLHQQCVSISGA